MTAGIPFLVLTPVLHDHPHHHHVVVGEEEEEHFHRQVVVVVEGLLQLVEDLLQ